MPHAPHSALERRRLIVTGIVQGVGFRPFVHSLAERWGLAGFVLNDSGGVVIEVEGDAETLDAFAAAVTAEAPALARVAHITTAAIAPLGRPEFTIARSKTGAPRTLVAPDAATCADCLRELYDPADTTMATFEMCADCRREYEDPADRRFHAEPVACPKCGPRLSMPLEDA